MLNVSCASVAVHCTPHAKHTFPLRLFALNWCRQKRVTYNDSWKTEDWRSTSGLCTSLPPSFSVFCVCVSYENCQIRKTAVQKWKLHLFEVICEVCRTATKTTNRPKDSLPFRVHSSVAIITWASSLLLSSGWVLPASSGVTFPFISPIHFVHARSALQTKWTSLPNDSLC